VFDDAMNVISMGTLFVGVFGALAAWATSLRNRRQLRELKKSVERLPALLEEIKKKPVAGLDSTQSELDRLTEWFVEKYIADKISSDVFDSAATRVAHLRDIIKKRQETSEVVVDEQAKSEASKKRSSVEAPAS
jgi:hypothetical protein